MSRYNLRRSQATRIIPLSRCPGPKLRAFKHQHAEIEWGRRVDGDRTGMPETDGYVFEVKIQSRVYALKVYYWGVYLGNSMPLKRVIYYTDPFFAECRAYGRIEEANERLGIKDQSAVKCHGYIYLGDKDMRMLERMGLDLRTEVLDAKLRRALDGGGRVRAIVKDLAPSHTTVNSRNIRVALSRVVDFGSSWTEPHIILDALEPDDAEDSRLEDLVMFDDMIEEEKIKTRPKLQVLHNVDVEHQKELKLRKKSKC
ncbi:kinetochore Sim4 complex subunit FTA2-domain-containing protein [Diaporthe sp. PMI_573]|nr:kinetochore Sim4 complex subunit FTA2-domain-containing protein [Diaporthaceae sp. PMI_573]